MYHFTFLIATAGVFGAPVFAQVSPSDPLPGVDGSWTMTRNGPGGVTSVKLDLKQFGSRIEGRERILNPSFAVALRLSGEFTGEFDGILNQTAVEQLGGLPSFCLQAADFSMTEANRISILLKPSERCEADDVITLTRDTPVAPGSVRHTDSPMAAGPPASFSGVWTATIRNLRAGPVNIRIDLAQNGNRIAGYEQIADTNRGIALRLDGELTGSRTGYLVETTVEQTRGFRKSCLQRANVQISGPDRIDVHWQPSSVCGGIAQDIAFTRAGPAAMTAQRNEGVSPSDALMMLLMMGLSGSDPSSPSAREEEERYQKAADLQYQQKRDVGPK